MNSETECQLELKSINTYYGKSHILYDVSMKVRKGELVGLLGRNGVGKSTTLNSIMGVVTPQSGSIIFEGNNICGLQPYQIARRGIGIVPEERRIFPTITVRENLLMGQKPAAGSQGNEWTIDKIYEYMPLLKKLDGNKGGYLSGGEKQMLSIARSLMGNPSLLLLDEPMEGLAPVIVNELCGMIKRINETGVSIILVEGSMRSILQVCQRVYVMAKGAIVFDGSADELEQNKDIQCTYLEV
ncbi:MAG TPA: ABC transporter ATP-binding protein [Smithella sp.]|nr:ABC transporter ATP-binding protein [Smithella sp.]